MCVWALWFCSLTHGSYLNYRTLHPCRKVTTPHHSWQHAATPASEALSSTWALSAFHRAQRLNYCAKVRTGSPDILIFQDLWRLHRWALQADNQSLGHKGRAPGLQLPRHSPKPWHAVSRGVTLSQQWAMISLALWICWFTEHQHVSLSLEGQSGDIKQIHGNGATLAGLCQLLSIVIYICGSTRNTVKHTSGVK